MVLGANKDVFLTSLCHLFVGERGMKVGVAGGPQTVTYLLQIHLISYSQMVFYIASFFLIDPYNLIGGRGLSYQSSFIFHS